MMALGPPKITVAKVAVHKKNLIQQVVQLFLFFFPSILQRVQTTLTWLI